MRKIIILLLLFVSVIALGSCQFDSKVNTDIKSKENINKASSYQIQSYTNLYKENDKLVEYPQLIGKSNDFSNINLLIRNETIAWLNDIVDTNTVINVTYTITYQDDVYVCVLFEGDVYAVGSAHPINIVHSVCISLDEEKCIDPLSIYQTNENLIDSFKKGIIESFNDNHYTQAEWEEIVRYIIGFSDDELRHKIQNGTNALIDDGILICVDVPHAIGDYIKIRITKTEKHGTVLCLDG